MILSFFEVKPSCAFTPVTDDFSNLENWFVSPEDKVDTWFVADGWLVGDVARRESSYLFLKDELEGTYIYLTYDGVNLRGIDQELVFGYNTIDTSRYIINTRFYQAGWPDNANEVVLWKCSSSSVSSCIKLATSGSLGFTLEKNKEYKYQFVFNNNTLHFYIGNTEVFTFSNLSPDELIGKIGFWNWGGDYSFGSSNRYDNFSISVGNTDPTGTPTLISTPTPYINPNPYSDFKSDADRDTKENESFYFARVRGELELRGNCL